MPRRCLPGTCTLAWTGAPGATGSVQHCTTCGLVPCASPLDHDYSTHPVPLRHFPPEFDRICRKCGVRDVWSPLAGATMDDPHVLVHDHDAQARRFGHKPRDIATEDAALLASLLDQAAKNAKPAPAGRPIASPIGRPLQQGMRKGTSRAGSTRR